MKYWLNDSIFVLLCFDVVLVFGQYPNPYYLPQERAPTTGNNLNILPTGNNQYLNSLPTGNNQNLNILPNDSPVIPMGNNGYLPPGTQLTLNSTCLISDTNDIGYCLRQEDCPGAERVLNFRRPPICFYIGLTPVVCCPEFEERAGKRRRRPGGSSTGQLAGAGAAPGQCSASTGMSERMCQVFHSRGARSKREPSFQDSQYNFLNQISGAGAYFAIPPPSRYFPPFDEPPKTKALYIVGESSAAGPNEFPHMAALGWLSGNSLSFDCGGFVVDRGYVVTAAHCLRGGKPDYARLGGLSLSDRSVQADDIPVTSFTVHPSYRSTQMYYDIAILKLGRCAPSRVIPACLWNQNLKVDYRMEAIGYGVTDVATNVKSNTLLKIELVSKGNEHCQTIYRRDRLRQPRGIVDEQLCAGYPMELGKPSDTCSGDSGGPVGMKMQKSYASQTVPFIMGVTSFGVSKCNAAYSVYTRISSYVCWIEQNVWGSSGYTPCN